MEFAGKDLIYLSKIKKEKIKKLREAEKGNKNEPPKIEDQKEKQIKEKAGIENLLNKLEIKNKDKNNLDLSNSDDAEISVNSEDFDKDMEQFDKEEYIVVENISPAPDLFQNKKKKNGQIYKKEIDTNVCVIKYNSLSNLPESQIEKLYKCKKCNSYLNKYSNLIEKENKKY